MFVSLVVALMNDSYLVFVIGQIVGLGGAITFLVAAFVVLIRALDRGDPEATWGCLAIAVAVAPIAWFVLAVGDQF